MGSGGHHDLHWAEETTDDLGAAAAASFRYQWLPATSPTKIVLEGPCPACGEPFVYDWPLVAVRDWTENRATSAEPVTVYCQCRRPHAGRPEGEGGCGRYWDLNVPTP